MLKIIKDKMKSWALWLAIAALIVFCIKEFCNIDISHTLNGILDRLLPILIAFGIVNNPNSRNTL